MDSLDELVSDSRLTNYARRLGIDSPLEAGVTEWKGRPYYHVSGLDRNGRRILIEVFRINAYGKMEAVMAFAYPPPIRALYSN